MEREQRLICCDGNSANASGDRSGAVFTAKTVLVRKLDRLRVVFFGQLSVRVVAVWDTPRRMGRLALAGRGEG
jgi:hypothetical protein